MRHALAVTMLLVAMVPACGRDKPEAPQQPPPPPPAATAPEQQAPEPVQTEPAAPAVAPAAAELAAAPRLYTVQVAAFTNAASARALRARLEAQNVPVWVTTARVGGVDFTRVRIGVATTPADARALAQKLRAQYQWPVWITTVSDRNALSADALTATRAYAGRN